MPLAAGTAQMHYRRFLLFNLIGAISWACGLTTVGVLLGGIPLVAHNIDALMIVIVLVSVLPLIIGAPAPPPRHPEADVASGTTHGANGGGPVTVGTGTGSRVPEPTASFWLIKVLTTGMGEALSDFLVTAF